MLKRFKKSHCSNCSIRINEMLMRHPFLLVVEKDGKTFCRIVTLVTCNYCFKKIKEWEPNILNTCDECSKFSYNLYTFNNSVVKKFIPLKDYINKIKLFCSHCTCSKLKNRNHNKYMTNLFYSKPVEEILETFSFPGESN